MAATLDLVGEFEELSAKFAAARDGLGEVIFGQEDVIDLTQFGNIDSIDDLQITQNGANTVIQAGNTEIVLENFDSGNLNSFDFDFA